MKKISLTIICLVTLAAALIFFSSTASGMDDGHDMDSFDKIGELFHESMQNGYMLSYYLMDLRNQGDDKAAVHSSGDHASHGEKQMDKPHLFRRQRALIPVRVLLLAACCFQTAEFFVCHSVRLLQ